MTDSNTSEKILVQEIQRHSRRIEDIHTTTSDETSLIALPISRGETELSCEGKLLRNGKVHPGMLGFFPPCSNIRSVFRSPWHSIRLSVPFPFLLTLLPEANFDIEKAKLLSTPCKEVVLLTWQLQQTSALDPVHQQLFLDGIIRSLWATLLHSSEKGFKATKKLPALTPHELARSIDFAEAHLQTELNIAEWSAVLQLSTSEFSRRFHVATGKSPYRWFLDRRLDHAKDTLLAEDLDLAQVGRCVGFLSQSQFGEAFRRYTGLTPSRWRASYSGHIRPVRQRRLTPVD